MNIESLRQFINNFHYIGTGIVSIKLVQKINQDYEVYEPISTTATG